MEKVFLGLGSNIEDREYHLFNALNWIAIKMGKLSELSSIYFTEPWGKEGLNPFLNMVCTIQTEFSPMDLLVEIEKIERTSGRIRDGKGYTDREIDVDILFFGSKIIRSKSLRIPHFGLDERNFVLVPLNEIAPAFIHPASGLSVNNLLQKSPDNLKVSKYMDRNEVRKRFDQLFSEYSVI